MIKINTNHKKLYDFLKHGAYVDEIYAIFENEDLSKERVDKLIEDLQLLREIIPLRMPYGLMWIASNLKTKKKKFKIFSFFYKDFLEFSTQTYSVVEGIGIRDLLNKFVDSEFTVILQTNEKFKSLEKYKKSKLFNNLRNQYLLDSESLKALNISNLYDNENNILLLSSNKEEILLEWIDIKFGKIFVSNNILNFFNKFSNIHEINKKNIILQSEIKLGNYN